MAEETKQWRRRRSSVPTEVVNGGDGGDAEDDVSSHGASSASKDAIFALKRQWGMLLDRIDEELTRGDSRVNPTGLQTQDQIMQLWGKLTWPMVFVSQTLPGSLQPEDAEILQRTIPIAVDAETALENELRIKIGLSCVYADLIQSLTTHTPVPTTLSFRRAAAGIAAVIQSIHDNAGIDLGDDFRNTFLSIPLVAQLTLKDGADSFSKTDAGGELLLVSLYDRPPPTGIVEHVCAECRATLDSVATGGAPPSFNIARGIIFSDASVGIACVARSTLPEFGAVIDTGGRTPMLRLSMHAPDKFFDYAFDGRDGGPLGDGSSGIPAVWGTSEDVYAYVGW